MTDEEKKGENLRKAAELFMQDHVTPEDLGGILKHLYGSFKKEVQDFFDNVSEKVNTISSDRSEEISSIHTKINEVHTKIDGLVDDLRTEIREIELTPGDPGDPGKDADPLDENKIIESILARIEIPEPIPGKNGSPDTAEEIYEKLLAFLEEEGLPAKYIKDLPKAVVNRPFLGGATALHALSDVDVSGITNGQSIKWNGSHWVIYTPTAALTSVFGEAPTDSGDHTSFTIANTPAAGHLRVYRGGSRLSAVASNYSLSGATLTLANPLATNEELYLDYDY